MPDDKSPAGRLGRLGRRLMGEEGEGRPFRVDAREVLQSVLEGSDKAKSEIVRVVAREVRSYFEELGLKDDLHHLLTNYAFEIRASLNLRKLTEVEKGESAVPRAEEGENTAPAPAPDATEPPGAPQE